ncbi:MAG: transposase [Planctomycetaceae bacterium]
MAGSPAAAVGAVLKRSGQELIHHWNRLDRQEIVRSTFDGHYRRLRGVILDALDRGTSCGESNTAETCRRLLNECYSLFVFVHHPGVSPTNNAAEQALRKSVIYRKLSFGTESQTGSRTLARDPVGRGNLPPPRPTRPQPPPRCHPGPLRPPAHPSTPANRLTGL